MKRPQILLEQGDVEDRETVTVARSLAQENLLSGLVRVKKRGEEPVKKLGGVCLVDYSDDEAVEDS